MNIDRQNYEEYFMLYSDQELDAEQQHAVETFLLENPDLGEELELFQSVKLTADTSINHPDISSLYRPQEKKRAVPLFKWWYAAAAVLLIAGGVFRINQYNAPTRIATIGDSLSGEKENIRKEPLIAATAPDNGNGEMPAVKKRIPDEAVIITNTHAIAGATDNRKIKKDLQPVKTSTAANYTASIDNSMANREEDADLPLASKPLSINNVNMAQENGSGINTSSVLPVAINKNIINTSSTSIAATNAQPEDAASENYFQAKKNTIRGIFRKASGIVDKAAGLRSSRDVKVHLGDLEIALH